jgi:POT family proton-dependent oligopeptide transporter
MALATLMFWLGRHKFIHVQPPEKASSYFKQTFSKEGLAAIARVSVIFAFIPLFWSLFDQMSSTWLFQAMELNRILPSWIPLFGGKEILPEQINGVFNPLFILILIPVFNYAIYPAIDKIFPLTALRKIGIGFFVMTVGFGMVAVVNMSLDAGTTPHIGWQILGCAIVTAAEVMISITGLEFAYTQAPRYMKSFVLSLFLLTVSLGNFVTAGFTHLITDENGQAILGRTEELWFWTGMILLTGLIFIPVAMKYKVKEYLQEEEDLVIEPLG